MELGIKCHQEILQQIQQDFDTSFHLISLLRPDGLYVDELITLFCQELPLAAMAQDPQQNQALEQNFRHTSS